MAILCLIGNVVFLIISVLLTTVALIFLLLMELQRPKYETGFINVKKYGDRILGPYKKEYEQHLASRVENRISKLFKFSLSALISNFIFFILITIGVKMELDEKMISVFHKISNCTFTFSIICFFISLYFKIFKEEEYNV
jgi:hypothetical protein